MVDLAIPMASTYISQPVEGQGVDPQGWLWWIRNCLLDGGPYKRSLCGGHLHVATSPKRSRRTIPGPTLREQQNPNPWTGAPRSPKRTWAEKAGRSPPENLESFECWPARRKKNSKTHHPKHPRPVSITCARHAVQNTAVDPN